jgi:DNA-binding transcriptional LysR family regulator
MDLQQLRYFLTCIEKGSLSRAAEELFTTQPHVSQVIRSLEQELGVKLFQRTGSGIVPTDHGERIRFYAQNALKYAAMIQESSAEADTARLRIAANPSGTLALSAAKYYIHNTDGKMNLHYTVCRIEHIMDLLEHRQFDLGLLFLPSDRVTAFSRMIERRRLVFTPLLDSDLVVYCGPKGPFYAREIIAPEELDGCRCIQTADDFFSLEDLLLENKAFHTGKFAIRKQIRANSDTLITQVLRETELCNIGSFWHAKERDEGEFSMSVIDGFQGKVSFGVMTREGADPSRPAKEFLELLTQKL